jgi:hypothetical protein
MVSASTEASCGGWAAGFTDMVWAAAPTLPSSRMVARDEHNFNVDCVVRMIQPPFL